jgi:Heat induced stress protein YflT domain
MEKPVLQNESVIAVFSEYQEADAAVKKLTNAGMTIKNLSVIGKGYHSEEKIVGFYRVGDRIKFWGKRGAFWSGFWDLFDGGISLTIPVVGHVIVLGYLAPIVVSAVEGAIMVGGLGTLAAALYSAGISRDSVIQYEQAVKADGFLVIVHGAAEELLRAQAILALGNPSRLDLHDGLTTSWSTPLHALAPPTFDAASG